MNELNELYEALRDVQREIAEWKDSAGEDFFDGDRGYQRLLEKESDFIERIIWTKTD